MFYATFNNVSVIYHSFAVGRGFKRLMFIATFNNVSVFYHTSAVGMGVQDAHALCHFQCSVIDHTIAIGRGFRRLMFIAIFNNVQSSTTPLLWEAGSGGSCFMSLTIFSHLPHSCCWQGGSRVSWFMPLSILFQSFTTLLL